MYLYVYNGLDHIFVLKKISFCSYGYCILVLALLRRIMDI